MAGAGEEALSAKLIELRDFEKHAKKWNCSLVKKKKEWAIYDDLDGAWVSGFATVSGRKVKEPYVKLFEKKIQFKRNVQRQQ